MAVRCPGVIGEWGVPGPDSSARGGTTALQTDEDKNTLGRKSLVGTCVKFPGRVSRERGGPLEQGPGDRGRPVGLHASAPATMVGLDYHQAIRRTGMEEAVSLSHSSAISGDNGQAVRAPPGSRLLRRHERTEQRCDWLCRRHRPRKRLWVGVTKRLYANIRR
jgi:hypothetical protein